MNKIWVIARKDISEAFRSRSTYVIIIIMIILTISYISGYESNVKTLTSQESIDIYSRGFLNNLAYIIPMMFSIFIVPYLIPRPLGRGMEFSLHLTFSSQRCRAMKLNQSIPRP